MYQALKPGELARRFGVTVKTLQRWDAAGKLVAKRTATGRRYYTEDQYLEYIGQKPQTVERKVVAYARVSSHGQKDDLASQIEFLRHYANGKGVIVDEFISDIGSGLNYNRKRWNALLDDVMTNKISTIYITYKDRFVRFGYDWFERLCEKHGTKIVVLNNETTSPNEELVKDLTSIIHVFSCRLYGLRKYKKQIVEDQQLEVKDGSSD